jgi:preprotein translocase subunit SecG
MTSFLIALHVIVCFVLILVVLLQRGKGGDAGAALGGGGSNTVFGSRGAGNFLTKLTTGSAIIYMLTSLSLAYLGNEASNPLDFTDEIREASEESAGETSEDAASAGDLEEIQIESESEPSANVLEEIVIPVVPAEE